MPKIISIAEAIPAFTLQQSDAVDFARELFSESFKDIERLLRAFENGQIQKRHFVKDLDWFKKDHTFEEKNDSFIEAAVKYGTEAIQACLGNDNFLRQSVPYEEIEAIFLITTTGLATPSIEARIMNQLPFSPHTKRIPIWGLGCAGGAGGLARASEYCRAFPKAKVLVLTIELCSLTFQRNDRSKSNLIGTSLFADGISCALLCGDEVDISNLCLKSSSPAIVSSQSTLMPNSLDVMGWDVRNNGLYVVFSRDIPSIVEEWLSPNVTDFLDQHDLTIKEIEQFVAHPGGKKVLEAYVTALDLPESMIDIPLEILREYGNMSSATIMYVLRRTMEMDIENGTYGLGAALGPGFSSELLLLRWE
ncbi:MULTISPECIES: type III polyketide synthase [unclassified Bacillus (in: firmicutes)]|uniref:type III polyketide synthase n=1 Tax=unclassified Bacillus (in: firmicutes) TaxID=185979 RepID=UPI0008EFA897|nr:MULTISPECIES: 3-oxoacyl-[acyl-carrier-protein] synthase III C-terminal domain-containing protein [unclassified Bacillus (in: firmicutes)]SFA99291.1 15-methylpalmitoyl-4-hydroxy-2-pyrone synthase [Bacillus sp. UNCCL13]SFQ81555.1 15-methylpalmitoyl-4-hydroxy-2-pyrone synthase [Bacillus sp. cl95]